MCRMNKKKLAAENAALTKQCARQADEIQQLQIKLDLCRVGFHAALDLWLDELQKKK